jgi:hypothetical protein
MMGRQPHRVAYIGGINEQDGEQDQHHAVDEKS